ncbi:hypothetical protein Cfla_0896 [Cellulomonas flavigena DSM 20109]|uniref:O-antigen ligase-related domain-containing protein n=1 Tax=Cellulomonas flavigena (strain ATCC 482 / DSM 20109 / BCRC 11376 / JCM 18109 / NBRC 3775 / NCIMB 8073 / NRS 134) TaxID=446466 RepID=D5UK63_CELFN|nr:O-antigen ligase family protein [Cellulomonas flavigena]ADG73805.1 hypothetical protein Cfla_0896 [Cellulomonas flavigena DSM 20109]
MALLGAWLLACLTLAWLARRRPLDATLVALAVWVLVPAAAGGLLTGHSTGLLGIHPASWLVLAVVGVQVLRAPADLARVVAQRLHLVVALTLVVAVAALTTQQLGTGGLALLVDVVVVPALMFLLVLTSIDDDPRAARRARTTVLALAAVCAAFALVQWSAGRLLLYEDQFATRYWFREDFDRYMATLDSPLTLSMLLCVALPLLVGLRRAGVQFALVALFVGGTVVTQSRTGVVLVGVLAVWVVIRSQAPAHVRLLSLCALGGGTAALLGSGIAAGVAARFTDDEGSAGARTDAFRFFAETWQDYPVLGRGLTASYRYAALGGLQTSLENSFLMYAVDIGILFALVYFGAQLLLVAEAWTRSTPLPGARVAATVAFVLPMTYNALAARSASGALLWVALALGVARYAAPADPPSAGRDAPGRTQALQRLR